MNAIERFNSETGFNKSAVVMITLAAAIFVFALSLFLVGGFRAVQAVDAEAKLAESVDPQLQTMMLEAQARLDAPAGWLDRERGVVSLPIDEAMRLVVQREASATGSKEVMH